MRKKKIVSKLNNKRDTSEELEVGQTIYNDNPEKRNKKHNEFLGSYLITELLERNRVKTSDKKA